MTHFMLDLETMGNGTHAAITQIGVTSFNMDGLGFTFFDSVCLESCDAMCLDIDASTVLWWLKQKDEARAHLHSPRTPPVPITEALTNLTSWLEEIEPDYDSRFVWGNGSPFDNVILRSAYKMAGMKSPWSWRKDRCYRTIKKLAPDIELDRGGFTAHNAIFDARCQAMHLIQILKALDLPLR